MVFKKIKKHSLIGRSGSQFPVWRKWDDMLQSTGKKYLICNAAESEPGVFKDKHILKKDPEKAIYGITVAMKTLGIDKGFIYLKRDYQKLFGKKLRKIVNNKPIEIKLKKDIYIAGEETAAINSIENGVSDPEIKPPYPTESGLWGRPTLIHNVETFYAIAEIADESYKNKRYYCLSGAVENEGVFKLDVDLTIEEILKVSNNYPDFEFLVQVGGGLGGVFLNEDELSQKCDRLGSIRVFRRKGFNSLKKMESISHLVMYGNCDKCTPCREGVFRVYEMLNNDSYDKDVVEEIVFALKNSSYCPLGRVMGQVFESLIRINEN